MLQSIQRNRLLDDVLVRLKESPVVALLGARQVGKTTLARMIMERWPEESVLLDLEVPATREALERSPTQLLLDRKGLVVIDEIQRLPQLFSVLRPLADDPNRRATFLLLGSASWDLIKGVSESLAGRIQVVDVSGFSIDEVGPSNQSELWLRGGFPRAFLAEDTNAWKRWVDAFSRTLLERDIPNLIPRIAPAALGRFWTMLAHYHGQVWNGSDLARSMDVSTTAVNHYRDVLAGTFLIRVLQPWFENLGKRLVKSPKIYMRDSGILHNLLSIDNMLSLQTHPRYGASWEGFALEQTLIAHGERDTYFYATHRGAELDLLLIRNGKRYGFEFKCSDAPTTTKSMHVALDDLKLEHLWVVYPGALRYDLMERISALPLREIGTVSLTAPPPNTNLRWS